MHILGDCILDTVNLVLDCRFNQWKCQSPASSSSNFDQPGDKAIDLSQSNKEHKQQHATTH